MPAAIPEQIHTLFTEAFRAGDLDRLMELYEPGATLVPQPGEIASGHAAIRQALSAFLGMKAKFELKFDKVIQAHDIALLHSNWTLTGKTPDGKAINMAGRTADVVRRQSNGAWLLIIDSPFGGA